MDRPPGAAMRRRAFLRRGLAGAAVTLGGAPLASLPGCGPPAPDAPGPRLHQILEPNPEAIAIAEALDAERAAGRVRGPLHGIPVLIKDNIGTADRMTTTAGSLALEGSRPARDAPLVGRLRQAGAVILGKTNLSEWANFRSTRSTSGWSGRGGQGHNPYVLDRQASGSSAGSAAAVAASFAAVSVGTETDGSIVSPANNCSIVGLKPTLGLVSRSGIVPIAHSQDTAGPMARTVTDAAILLSAMAGPDPEDAATTGQPPQALGDLRAALDPDGLRGARLGVVRDGLFGYSPFADAIAETALDDLRRLGATIVDPANLPSLDRLDEPELEVLLYEFKADLDAYLAGLGPGAPVGSLAEAIAVNEANRDLEMPYFGQEIFSITVPAGYAFGLPVGLSFFGRAWSKPTLIRLAYAYERATTHRRPPRFLPTAEL